jgi:hypothetical protein
MVTLMFGTGLRWGKHALRGQGTSTSTAHGP